VGPQRGDLLKKELGIFTFNDLLHHFPYRHIDRTGLLRIIDLNAATEFAQVQGTLLYSEIIGEKTARRLVAYIKDSTGTMELTWFRGITWTQKLLTEGTQYTVFGRLSFFMGKPQIVHPEIERATETTAQNRNLLQPVYATTEKLKSRGLGSKQIGVLVQALLQLVSQKDLPENLPASIIDKAKLTERYVAYCAIHFPADVGEHGVAVRRLKFEELFISQLRLALVRSERHRLSKGVLFAKVGDNFNTFYKEHLPFSLTGAQKRVLKEIRVDTASGHQMNRLLQGDVGSGKTIVALLAMLLAIDNGFQCCLMAPTKYSRSNILLR
jgi:ATP-dependent DNA helicase RecG